MLLAKMIIILFGCFLIGSGLLMLLNPQKAKTIIGKAGSTNLINYGEITIRMIPGIALAFYSGNMKYGAVFYIVGCFIVATSLILYFIPRQWHHSYSNYWANKLKHLHLRLISPISMLLGTIMIYAVI